MTAGPHTDVAMFGWLLRQGRAYWGKLGALSALSLLATPLALLVPVPLMLVVDSVIGGRPLPALLDVIVPDAVAASRSALLGYAAAMVVVVALLAQMRNAAGVVLEAWVGQRLLMELRAKLFAHAQRLSATYHDAKGTADTLYRIQSDAPGLQSLLVHGLTPFLTAGLTLVSMLLVVGRLDASIALLALVIAPVVYVLTSVFRARLRRQWRYVKEAESGAQSVVHEVLSALRVVQAFGREEAESTRFADRAWRSVRENVRVVALDSVFGILIGATLAIGTALVLWLGAIRVERGALTVGQLLLVMSYLAQLYAPMTQIGKQVTKIQGWLSSADRVREFLREPPTIVENPRPRRMARAAGAVRFENVSFSYDSVHDVLRNVSFDIPAGSRVGIVGPTGSGKSTLASLLTRFHDPSRGRILLDGVDLREYALARLRDQFALVLQDTVLFSASIAENIAYGRPQASQAEIVRAAQAANADLFIRELPDGYETGVGERGMRLSGGQRQRIALARAFLRDAPILVLDEPTSAVDFATESLIMASLNELMRGRTTFMIAHRLSTLDGCDLILRLDRSGHAAAFEAGPRAVAMEGRQ